MRSGLPGTLRARHSAPGAQPEAALAHLYPDYAVYNVEAPDCYFRRFTPDGKYLIAFNRTLTGMQVFRVANASPSVQSLADAGAGASPWKGEFWRFFRLAWARTYAAGSSELLHRDMCLVTPNARHLLVARLRRATPATAAAAAAQPSHPNALACLRSTEDVALLVIDIRTGDLVDTREYPCDNIYFGSQNGVSVYEDLLCLLSLKHQCLRLLRIGATGKLADVQEIGWYTREDDAICEQQLRTREAQALIGRALAAKRSHHSAATPDPHRKRRRTESPAADDAHRAWPAMHHAAMAGRDPPPPPPPPFPDPADAGLADLPPIVDAGITAGITSGVTAAADPGVDALLSGTVDRAVLISYRLLQGLPSRYRLMFRRIMHPAARLDTLADSDIMAIEPSLTTAPYGGLKQKLLAALFTRARAANDHGQQLHYFFRTFRQYEGLVLWRAQFVTRTRLLLRFVALQVATSRSLRGQPVSSSTLANAFTLLAEYDVPEARFGRIWDSADEDLYAEVEQRLDVYRVPMAGPGSARAPSSSNDVYLRDAFESAQAATRAARSGGPVQAMRKASVVLPLAPQSTQESALLDPSHYQCNMRVRQALERFRPVSLAPIRFFDRATGAVKFVLSPAPGASALQPAADDAPRFGPPELPGARLLRTGAILAPAGPEEAELLGESAAAASAPQATPTAALPLQPPPPPPAAAAAAIAAAAQLQPGHKPGVIYLFHPTLPLVLSIRSDRATQAPLPICNIHFRFSG